MDDIALRNAPASRRFTRRHAVLGGALLAGPATAACAGPAGVGSDGAGAAAQPVVELRTHARADSEKAGYQQNVDQFNERHTGKIRATYEPLASGYYQPLETLIAGGTVGDVHYAHQSNLKFQEFIVRGAAAPLDAFIAKDRGFKFSDWPPRAQDAMRIVEGKTFGLPVRGQVTFLFVFFNKDLLRSAGVPEPNPNSTLDELVQSARQLQKPGTDFYPIGTYWGGYYVTTSHLRRFGGEFFSPGDGAGTKCVLDSETNVAAFRWFYQHYRSGLFAPRSYGWPEFGAGKTAMFFGVRAGERATAKNNVGANFAWTFRVVPKGPTGRRGGMLSIDTVQLNTQSKHKDAAWELLKWLTNKQSGINLALQADGSTTPGFRKDVYCSPELLNEPGYPPEGMQTNCDNIDAPEGYSYPHNFRLTQPGAIEEVTNKYVLDFADGKGEPTPSVLRQLTRDIQNILDQPRL